MRLRGAQPAVIQEGVVRLGAGLPDVGVATAGHGIPFVFLHGIGFDTRTYYQCLQLLARLGFLAVGIDAPGHGRTPSIRRPASFTARAKVLDRALQRLGIERCLLGGHSMGGRNAVRLTALRPERTLLAVLVDAAVGANWDSTAQHNANDRRALVRESRTLLLDSGRDVRTVGLAAGRDAVRSYVSALRSVSRGISQFEATARAVAVCDSRQWLNAVAAAGVPAVVVHGELDMVVDVAHAREAAAALSAPLYLSRTAHHSWLLASPYSFGLLMRDLVETEIRPRLDGVSPSDCLGVDSPLTARSNCAKRDTALMDRGTPPFLFSREGC